jgi:hypothetical protein
VLQVFSDDLSLLALMCRRRATGPLVDRMCWPVRLPRAGIFSLRVNASAGARRSTGPFRNRVLPRRVPDEGLPNAFRWPATVTDFFLSVDAKSRRWVYKVGPKAASVVATTPSLGDQPCIR